MTNTNDFRKYSYYNDPSYLISGFDVRHGSQAPKMDPETQTSRSRFKVHENPKVKDRIQLRFEQSNAHKQSLKIFAIAAVCLVLISGVLCAMAVKNEYTRQLAKQEQMISNAQSENISLRSQLDSMVSISMIDEYAVNELGMTKVKSNQIQYMDVDEYKDAHQPSASDSNK